MVAVTASAARFDTSRVVRQVFGLLGQNWVPFGLLAILLMATPQTLWAWGLRLTGHDATVSGAGTYLSIWYWATVLVHQATDSALSATLICAAMAALSGRRPSFGECLRNGFRLFPTVFVIQLGFAVAFVVGLIFLVIPGVVIGMTWMMAVPAEVVERTGVVGAFRRSAHLTDQRKGELLGIVVAYSGLAIVLALALSAGVRLLVSAHLSLNVWVVEAFRPILDGILRTLAAVGLASIYYELRLLKEGVGPDQLATVFD